MSYVNSLIDKKNISWFKNDKTRFTLCRIKIAQGHIRGLKDLSVYFSYPITAIAGKNGAGKTTILGLASCAYKGHKFGGSFFHIREEDGLDNVEVEYEVLTDTPNPTCFSLIKGPNDRSFKNYNKQVNREVNFIGISRIVPPSENGRAIYERYMNKREEWSPVWGPNVLISASKIFRKNYKNLFYRDGQLVITVDKNSYSDFNMGAGERSAIYLLSSLLNYKEGTLVLIEEIELGLHEEAQNKLIEEIKTICHQRKLQIICTTHSDEILNALPPEGRIFLDHFEGVTTAIPGISSVLALGKLSGKSRSELDILVEDKIAKNIIEHCCTAEQRARVAIIEAGSALAVMRHLATRYKEDRSIEVCAILDGDMYNSKQQKINDFIDILENVKDRKSASSWVEKRLNFLPGTTWPEAWAIRQTSELFYERLANDFEIDKDQVSSLLRAGQRAKRHDEFYEIARNLNLDTAIVTDRIIGAAVKVNPSERERISRFIQGFLE